MNQNEKIMHMLWGIYLQCLKSKVMQRKNETRDGKGLLIQIWDLSDRRWYTHIQLMFFGLTLHSGRLNSCRTLCLEIIWKIISRHLYDQTSHKTISLLYSPLQTDVVVCDEITRTQSKMVASLWRDRSRKSYSINKGLPFDRIPLKD